MTTKAASEQEEQQTTMAEQINKRSSVSVGVMAMIIAGMFALVGVGLAGLGQFWKMNSTFEHRLSALEVKTDDNAEMVRIQLDRLDRDLRKIDSEAAQRERDGNGKFEKLMERLTDIDKRLSYIELSVKHERKPKD